MQTTRTPGQGAEFNPFWPVSLIAVSLLVVLVWNTLLAVQQWHGGYRISVQQEIAVAQTVQAEDKLKAMMMDLIELSKRDQDAKSIVKKYNVTFNQPLATAPAPKAEPAKEEEKPKE